MSYQTSIASKQNWLTLAAMFALVGLAWSGVLDGHSTDYLDSALLSSGAIYATARGINAIVSVLQGTELDAFVVTFTIGELLDPVNDLIERFSGMMMLAIGSLAMQKILLQLVSHSTFNVMLTLLGVGAVAASLWGSSRQYKAVSKLFIITVFLRFSLALVVLASNWADTIFLKDNESEQYEAIQEFQNELGLVGSRVGLNVKLGNEIREVEVGIQRNQKALKAEKTELYLNRIRLEEAEAKLKAFDKRSIWAKITRKTSVNIEGEKATIKKLEDIIRGNEYTVKALLESHGALKDRLSCLEQRSRGESCSMADTISKALMAANVKERIEALEGNVDELASNLINLLMSLILKSILLPLLFIYALQWIVRSLFLATVELH